MNRASPLEAWKAHRWEAGEEILSVTNGTRVYRRHDLKHWGDGVVHKADASRVRLLAHGAGWRLWN